MRITQINLNRSWAAQDLFVQHMAEHQIDVASVAEPVSVPRNSRWISSANGLSGGTYVGNASLNKSIGISWWQNATGFSLFRCIFHQI